MVKTFSSDDDYQTASLDIEIPSNLLEDNPTWSDLSVVIYNPKLKLMEIYNDEQAEERLSPCSTYKIPHTLIGLESNILNKDDNLYEWDKHEHPIKSWNKDHTLDTAIENSVVWYFQRLASKLGPQRTQIYLDQIDYGNNDISGGQSGYWLKSSLEISALEQIAFLEKLYNEKLDFSKEHQKCVKSLIQLSENENRKLFGKTGGGKDIGWFVGFIEEESNPIYFVVNMKDHPKANGQTAKTICLEILKKRGYDFNL
jgi:beta-lactamase class D